MQIYPFSIVRLLVKKLLQFKDPGRPKFYFGERGTPEEVIYPSVDGVSSGELWARKYGP